MWYASIKKDACNAIRPIKPRQTHRRRRRYHPRNHRNPNPFKALNFFLHLHLLIIHLSPLTSPSIRLTPIPITIPNRPIIIIIIISIVRISLITRTFSIFCPTSKTKLICTTASHMITSFIFFHPKFTTWTLFHFCTFALNKFYELFVLL